MKIRMTGVIFLAAAVGCGGPSAGGPGAKTAANESAPAPPSEEQIQKAQAQQQDAQQAAPGKAPAAPVVSENEREAFDKAVAKWEAAKKQGTDKKDCAALASAF